MAIFDRYNEIVGEYGDKSSTTNNVAELKKSSYDIVGINVNQVPVIIEAIDRYVDSVRNAINDLGGQTPSSALAGTVGQELSRYQGKIMEDAYAVVSRLLVFKDKLEAVAKVYRNVAQQNVDRFNGQM